ncbi:Gfo/Idh/MocA family protein [Piscibacillus salipiscarius]|uniref:Gfo/Idh/MocA family protein n=1 Tax=Piscibacillus salipiscarius TaxID=299480 RepID=UPI002436E5A6|nr:Gfo/Idh/MocA family oxidoreductase [Piscibacillus salipiscarius]
MQEKYGEREVYQSHSDLLKNDQIDLIYLAVPPKLHHPIALNIISYGKHILCEKPLANSTEEAYEMYEAAENKGVINAMNFPLPYQDEFSMMKSMVERQVLGEIKRVEFHMYFPEWPRAWQQNSWIGTREQGGFIREIGPHYLHLTSRLVGLPELEHSFVDYPHDSLKSENGFVVKLNINDVPVLFNGLSNIGQKEHMSYKIFGSKAVLELRNWRELILRTKDHDKEKVKKRSQSTTFTIR